MLSLGVGDSLNPRSLRWPGSAPERGPPCALKFGANPAPAIRLGNILFQPMGTTVSGGIKVFNCQSGVLLVDVKNPHSSIFYRVCVQDFKAHTGLPIHGIHPGVCIIYSKSRWSQIDYYRRQPLQRILLHATPEEAQNSALLVIDNKCQGAQQGERGSTKAKSCWFFRLARTIP